MTGIALKARAWAAVVARGRTRRHAAWLGLCDLSPAPEAARGRPLSEGELGEIGRAVTAWGDQAGTEAVAEQELDAEALMSDTEADW
jgi:hypothetical protein